MIVISKVFSFRFHTFLMNYFHVVSGIFSIFSKRSYKLKKKQQQLNGNSSKYHLIQSIFNIKSFMPLRMKTQSSFIKISKWSNNSFLILFHFRRIFESEYISAENSSFWQYAQNSYRIFSHFSALLPLMILLFEFKT